MNFQVTQGIQPCYMDIFTLSLQNWTQRQKERTMARDKKQDNATDTTSLLTCGDVLFLNVFSGFWSPFFPNWK